MAPGNTPSGNRKSGCAACAWPRRRGQFPRPLFPDCLVRPGQMPRQIRQQARERHWMPSTCLEGLNDLFEKAACRCLSGDLRYHCGTAQHNWNGVVTHRSPRVAEYGNVTRFARLPGKGSNLDPARWRGQRANARGGRQFEHVESKPDARTGD